MRSCVWSAITILGFKSVCRPSNWPYELEIENRPNLRTEGHHSGIRAQLVSNRDPIRGNGGSTSEISHNFQRDSRHDFWSMPCLITVFRRWHCRILNHLHVLLHFICDFLFQLAWKLFKYFWFHDFGMHCYIAETFFLKRTHKTIWSPSQHIKDNQLLTGTRVRKVKRSGKLTEFPGFYAPSKFQGRSTGLTSLGLLWVTSSSLAVSFRSQVCCRR